MSDNVRDEAAQEAYDRIVTLTAAESRLTCDIAIAHLAERGMVVLGPDGEPLDVRPALAHGFTNHVARLGRIPDERVRRTIQADHRSLKAEQGWPDGLYDICVGLATTAAIESMRAAVAAHDAAAEVES